MSETIDHRVINVKGVRVTVSLVPDYDTKPTDYDCYTEGDVAAWRRDEWCYVGVIVSLTDHPSVSDSLWGVEYGTASWGTIGLGKVINEHPVPDMLSELLPQVEAAHAQLATIMELWKENGS